MKSMSSLLMLSGVHTGASLAISWKGQKHITRTRDYPLPSTKVLDTIISLAEVRILKVIFSVNFKCKDTKR